jgi:predicted transcriptional regulator
MKKIISALIICAMLFATLLTVVPASAATTREQLKEQIDIAEALTPEKYSASSWENLQKNLKAAKEAYENENTQELILNMQLGTLKDAIKSLKIDTTELDALLAKVTEMEKASNDVKKLGYEQGDFTAASWATFQEAVQAAKDAKATNDLDTITAGTAAFKAAMEKIEYNPIPADLTKKLEDLLELADILIPADYSDSAWGMVELKTNQAKTLKDDKRLSTQVLITNELDTALRNLDPDKNLPKPPVLDYEYIDGLFAHIDSFSPDMFTAESWAELKKVYDEVKKVRETSKKQAEINDAAVELYNAQKKLVLAPKPVETDPTATEPAATTPADDTAGGCGGFVATSVAVVAVVATLGTAVVLKKKEN